MKREMILVPYNREWNRRYNEIRLQLSVIFKDIAIDIHHFGSTAVEGMPAKPIIDVMVIVKDISKVDGLNSDMIAAGYVPKGENGISGRRYFQKFSSDGVNHTEHIHCYEADNSHAREELMFRDYLKVDKDAFEYYKRVKIEASKKYKYSPAEYTDFKSRCVNEILKEAKAYYGIGSYYDEHRL